jgi:FlaA1/EpsC-like NDP-sugar epimerase
VTGAAGSIGSELCRQIARYRPKAIIGYEIAESELFHLEREMQERFPAVPFYPAVGSIQDSARVEEIMRQHEPEAVFHAAAYKHVPMMETHVFEAVKNNVFGTYNVAEMAERHGVEDFVMISTDKAVRPTSIMGVTKRVAELVVASLENGRTKYVSVRFGNVLGSKGSVVPIFKEQIARGGPVTVTHPEMRRYFMTIPEAAQLVLQASAMGRGGEIFVLDMGEPVIRIEFTGVRPGEKLYEEVNSFEEYTAPTHHEKIKIFTGNGLPYEEMADYLEELRQICAAKDFPRLILLLKELVPDYSPSAHILQRLVEPRLYASA